MVTLAPQTLAAILTLLAPGADLEPEADRLAPFAVAIDQAAAGGPALPFQGPAAREATALALVAIASHESAFRADVIDCRKRGAAGDATAFQLLGPYARGPYTVAQLCASPLLAAERAVAILAHQAGRCPRAAHVAAFQGYASGTCGRPAPIRIRERAPSGELVIVTKDTDGGLTRCRTWERLARAAGLEGARCDRRTPITFAAAGDAPAG